jgi:hypothetical protein
VRTDTNLYVEGHTTITVKITGDTVTKCSRPGDLATGICEALAKTMDKYDIAVKLSKAFKPHSQTFFNYVCKHLSIKFNLFRHFKAPTAICSTDTESYHIPGEE